MNIKALDLGSAVGYAWTRPEHNIDHGVMYLNPKTSREERFVRFAKWLGWFLTPPIDFVIYERPFCRGLAATRFLWGMAGIIETVATDKGYPVLDVVPATTKKWLTGSGNAEKEEMMAAVRTRGFDVTTDHEADAVALLLYAKGNVHYGKG